MQNSKTRKKSHSKKPSLCKCPICQADARIVKGYEEELYYVKCVNSCCVTKYASSMEEARKMWNSSQVVLTMQEKLRVGKTPYKISGHTSAFFEDGMSARTMTASSSNNNPKKRVKKARS